MISINCKLVFEDDTDDIPVKYLRYEDGEPCFHRGCHCHIKTPCEVCGRLSCKGSTSVIEMI